MNDEQVKYMVDRFLMWKLPDNFNPDNGIIFNSIGGEGGPFPFKREPSGTNLLDATQAEEMVRHMLQDLPAQPQQAPQSVLANALRAFAVHATYPVAAEINPRGYAWRGEDALDYAKSLADAALASTTQLDREKVARAIHDGLGGNGWAYTNYGGDEWNDKRADLLNAADAAIAACSLSRAHLPDLPQTVPISGHELADLIVNEFAFINPGDAIRMGTTITDRYSVSRPQSEGK